jgi:CBS domain-containing protein
MMMRHTPIDPGLGQLAERPVDCAPACVRERMRRPAVFIVADAPVASAWVLMKSQGISDLLVVDARGRLVGILNERDVRPLVLDRIHFDPAGESSPPSVCVERAVRRPPVTIGADAEVGAAAALMCRQKIGALAVVEAGTIVGVITSQDLKRP